MKKYTIIFIALIAATVMSCTEEEIKPQGGDGGIVVYSDDF